jgi:hypothetical protein
MAPSGRCSLSSRFTNCPVTQPQQFSVNFPQSYSYTFSRRLTPNWISLCHSRRLSLHNLTPIKSKSKLYYDWQSVSQSILVSGTQLVPMTNSSSLSNFLYIVVDLLLWDALSDERIGMWFTVATGSYQCTLSHVQLLWDTWQYFTVSNIILPWCGGPISCIYFPQKQGTQLYPPPLALGLLAPVQWNSCLQLLSMHHTENIALTVLLLLQVWVLWQLPRNQYNIHNATFSFCLTRQTGSVAFSTQANYANQATATSWQNLVPSSVDRGVSHGQHGRSPTAVNLSSSHYTSLYNLT